MQQKIERAVCEWNCGVSVQRWLCVCVCVCIERDRQTDKREGLNRVSMDEVGQQGVEGWFVGGVQA